MTIVLLTIDASLVVAAGALLRASRAEKARADLLSLRLWTLAWLLFVTHVATALVVVHHGSHAEAYAHTARRTVEMTGIDSGAGIYLNYLFTLAWTAEAAGRWLDYRRGVSSALKWYRAFDWLFAFMVVNGAIVFATGWVRLLGAIAMLALALSWWPRRSRHENAR